MKFSLLILGFVCLIASPVFGTVTFDIQAEQLNTSGGIAAPTSTLVMLVVDTNNDGFGAFQAGASLSANTALNSGGDDRIIYKTNILSTSGTAGVFVDFASLNLASITGWNASDSLALVWFPTLTTSTSTTTAGDTYGLFSGSALNGSDPWTTPADGSTGYKLYYFNSDATVLNTGGGQTATSGNASFTIAAVPEPSRMMLTVIGLGAFLMRRRRNV